MNLDELKIKISIELDDLNSQLNDITKSINKTFGAKNTKKLMQDNHKVIKSESKDINKTLSEAFDLTDAMRDIKRTVRETFSDIRREVNKLKSDMNLNGEIRVTGSSSVSNSSQGSAGTGAIIQSQNYNGAMITKAVNEMKKSNDDNSSRVESSLRDVAEALSSLSVKLNGTSNGSSSHNKDINADAVIKTTFDMADDELRSKLSEIERSTELNIGVSVDTSEVSNELNSIDSNDIEVGIRLSGDSISQLDSELDSLSVPQIEIEAIVNVLDNAEEQLISIIDSVNIPSIEAAVEVVDDVKEQIDSIIDSIYSTVEIETEVIDTDAQSQLDSIVQSLDAEAEIIAKVVDEDCQSELDSIAQSLNSEAEIIANVVDEDCQSELDSIAQSLSAEAEITAKVVDEDCQGELDSIAQGLDAEAEITAKVVDENSQEQLDDIAKSLEAEAEINTKVIDNDTQEQVNTITRSIESEIQVKMAVDGSTIKEQSQQAISSLDEQRIKVFYELGNDIQNIVNDSLRTIEASKALEFFIDQEALQLKANEAINKLRLDAVTVRLQPETVKASSDEKLMGSNNPRIKISEKATNSKDFLENKVQDFSKQIRGPISFREANKELKVLQEQLNKVKTKVDEIRKKSKITIKMSNEDGSIVESSVYDDYVSEFNRCEEELRDVRRSFELLRREVADSNLGKNKKNLFHSISAGSSEARKEIESVAKEIEKLNNKYEESSAIEIEKPTKEDKPKSSIKKPNKNLQNFIPKTRPKTKAPEIEIDTDETISNIIPDDVLAKVEEVSNQVKNSLGDAFTRVRETVSNEIEGIEKSLKHLNTLYSSLFGRSIIGPTFKGDFELYNRTMNEAVDSAERLQRYINGLNGAEFNIGDKAKPSLFIDDNAENFKEFGNSVSNEIDDIKKQLEHLATLYSSLFSRGETSKTFEYDFGIFNKKLNESIGKIETFRSSMNNLSNNVGFKNLVPDDIVPNAGLPSATKAGLPITYDDTLNVKFAQLRKEIEDAYATLENFKQKALESFKQSIAGLFLSLKDPGNSEAMLKGIEERYRRVNKLISDVQLYNKGFVSEDDLPMLEALNEEVLKLKQNIIQIESTTHAGLLDVDTNHLDQAIKLTDSLIDKIKKQKEEAIKAEGIKAEESKPEPEDDMAIAAKELARLEAEIAEEEAKREIILSQLEQKYKEINKIMSAVLLVNKGIVSKEDLPALIKINDEARELKENLTRLEVADPNLDLDTKHLDKCIKLTNDLISKINKIGEAEEAAAKKQADSLAKAIEKAKQDREKAAKEEEKARLKAIKEQEAAELKAAKEAEKAIKAKAAAEAKAAKEAERAIKAKTAEEAKAAREAEKAAKAKAAEEARAAKEAERAAKAKAAEEAKAVREAEKAAKAKAAEEQKAIREAEKAERARFAAQQKNAREAAALQKRLIKERLAAEKAAKAEEKALNDRAGKAIASAREFILRDNKNSLGSVQSLFENQDFLINADFSMWEAALLEAKQDLLDWKEDTEELKRTGIKINDSDLKESLKIVDDLLNKLKDAQGLKLKGIKVGFESDFSELKSEIKNQLSEVQLLIDNVDMPLDFNTNESKVQLDQLKAMLNEMKKQIPDLKSELGAEGLKLKVETRDINDCLNLIRKLEGKLDELEQSRISIQVDTDDVRDAVEEIQNAVSGVRSGNFTTGRGVGSGSFSTTPGGPVGSGGAGGGRYTRPGSGSFTTPPPEQPRGYTPTDTGMDFNAHVLAHQAEQVKAILDKLKNAFKDLGGKINPILKNLGAKIKDGLKGPLNKLVNTCKSAWNKITNTFKKGAKESSRAMDNMGGTIKQMLRSYFSLYTIIHWGREAIRVTEDQMQSEAKLVSIMKNKMNAAKSEVNAIRQLISAQQRLGVVSDEAQYSAAQQLAVFLKSTKALEIMLPAVNDMIAMEHGANASVDQAADVARKLGEVLADGQFSELQESTGITLTKAEVEEFKKLQTEEERAAALAKIIRDRIGDMNETLAKTPYGAMSQLKNNFKDLIAVSGAFIVNALHPIVNVLNKIIVTCTNAIRALGSLFGFDMTGTSHIEDTMQDYKDTTDAIEGATDAQEKFKGSLMGFDEINVLSDKTEEAADDRYADDLGTTGEVAGPVIEDINNGALDMMSEKLKAFLKEVAEPFIAAWDNLGDRWKKAWADLVESMKNFCDSLASFLKSVWDNGGKEFVQHLAEIALACGIAAMEIGGTILDALAKLWDHLDPEKNMHTQRLLDVLNEVSVKLRDFILGLNEHLENLLAYGGQDVLNAMGDCFMDLAAAAVNAFGVMIDAVDGLIDHLDPKFNIDTRNMLQATADMFHAVGQAAWDFSELLKSALANGGQDMINAFGTCMVNLGETVARVITTMMESLSAFFDYIDPAKNDITQAMMKAWEEAFYAIGDAALQFAELFESVMGNGGQEVLNKLGDAFNSLVGLAGTCVQEIADAMNGLFEHLDPKTNEFTQGMLKAWQDAFDGISEMAKTIGEVIGSAMDNGGQDIVNAIGDLGVRIVGAFGKIVDEVAGCVGELFKHLDPAENEIAKGALESFEYFIDSIGNFVDSLADALGTFMDNGGQEFVNNIADIIALIGDLAFTIGGDILNAISTFMDSWLGHAVISTCATALELVSEVLKGLLEILEPLSPIISGVVTAIGGFVIAQKVVGFIQGIVTAFQAISGAGGVLALAKGAFTALWGVLAANPIAATVAAIVGIGTAIVALYNKCEGFREFIDGILAGFQDLFNELEEAFSTLLEDVRNIFGNVIDIIVGIFTGDGERVGTAVRELIINIGDLLLDLSTSFVEIGWALIEGLVKGIWECIKAIPSLLAGVGDFIIDFFKGLFGIHSPSTVFAELGVNLIEGLVQGITDSIKSVTDAFKKIGDAIFDAGKEIVKTVSDKFKETKDAISEKLKETKEVVSEKWKEIKTTVSEKSKEAYEASKENWKNIYSATSDKCKEVYDVVKDKYTKVRDTVKENASKMYEDVSSSWTKMKEDAGKKLEQIKTDAEKKYDQVKSSLVKKIGEVKTETVNKWNEVKTSTIEGIEKVRSEAETKYESIKETMTRKLEQIRSTTMSKWEDIRKETADKVESLRTTAEEKYDSLKEKLLTKLENTKASMGSKWDAIKSEAVKKCGEMATEAHNKFSDIKGKFTSKMDEVKTALGPKWDNLKTQAFNGGKNIVSQVKSGLSNIGSTIGDAITGSKSKVTSALNEIGRVISGAKWSFPSVNLPKLPKIKIEWKELAGNSWFSAIKYPTLSWNARGGIIDGITPLGFANGALQMGGEAGKEMVVPLENTSFTTKIAKAMGQAVDNAMARNFNNMNGNNSNGFNDNRDIVLQVDGREFARASINNINKLQRESGRTLLDI
jgi:phage-related protein